MADPKIKYDIEAAVKGEEDAAALAKVLREVGDVLEGDLQQSAQGAAAALDALASKQRAIDEFAALKRETETLGSALTKATEQVDRIGNELPQAAANTQALAAAERTTVSALQQAEAALASKRAALKALRDETQGAARRSDEYKAAVAGLKEGIKGAVEEVKSQQAALRTSAQATTQAQNAEAALRKEYELAIGSSVKLSTELGNKRRALSETRDLMQSVGISTTNLVQAESSLKTAVGQVRQEVAAMAPAFQQAAAASSQSTQVQAQNQRTLREGMTSISTQLQNIQQIATAALGGSYAGGLIKDVAATADAFKNLEARIKLVTGEGPLFQESFNGVAQVALRTNTALDETGTLFTRITKAGQEAGLSAQASQQQALRLTETINQAVQLSGSSADASKAAVTQLIQGLQSGVLRGEEFNSVMEQAPRLAQALAAGLGVTTGELRRMAEQGALTTSTVITALRGQADVVAGEFGKLPPTVGRALQNLSTQWTLYVGSADKGLISSANAAKVIDALAKNLDVVVATLTAAGKAWAAIKISGLVADFARWATTTLTATAALEANTAAATRNTVAQQANTAAHAQNTAAQAANTAASAANTVARAANAKSWAEVGAFTRAAGAAQDVATAATLRSTAAVAANAAGAAQAGIVWRAASGLFGPWGIAVAALTPEIISLTRGLGEQVAKWAGWGARMEEAERKLRSMDAAQKEHAATIARQNQLYEEARNKTFELSKESVGLIAQFDKLRREGDSAAVAVGKIGKDFDLATQPGIKNAIAVLDKLVADGKLAAGEFQAAWSQSLNGLDLSKFEVMARTALTGTARESERVAQVMDAVLREAVSRTGLEFSQLQGRIGEVSRSAINDLDAIIGGLDRLKADGVDAGRVLNASFSKAIDTADSQKALDEVRARIEQVRQALGDKVADGLLDQARQKALDLAEALDKAKPGINSLSEAMKTLGLESSERLRQTADGAVKAFDVITRAGQQEGESYLAWQARKEEAARVMVQRMIDANRGIVDAAITARAAAAGLRVDVDESGRAIVRSMREAADATSNAGRAARGAAGDYRGLGQSAAGAAEQIKQLNDMKNRYRMRPVTGNTPEEIQRNAMNEFHDRYRLNGEQSDKDLADMRKNTSGSVTVSQEYIDQQVAQRYGDEFVGNRMAEQAFTLRAKLAAYRENYGNVVRSQESLNEQHGVMKALERLERLLEEERIKLNRRNGAQRDREDSEPRRPRRRDDDGEDSSPPRSRSSSGVSRGAGTVVNLHYQGQRVGPVNTDAEGANAITEFMRRLSVDRSTAGR